MCVHLGVKIVFAPVNQMSCPIAEAIKEMKEKLDRLEATKHLAIKIALKNKHGDIVGHALIDEEDRELTKMNWWSTGDGYAGNNDGLMHCLMMGEAPEGHIVDHYNHDRLDNRRANLRFSTHSLNASNRHSDKVTSSIFHGVCLHEPEKWCAEFKKKYLGRYRLETWAAWAYNIAAFEEFGKDANFNIIDKPDGWKDSRSAKKVKSRGVSIKHDMFYTSITIDKINYPLGSFHTESEASEVYEAALADLKAKKLAIHEAKEITKDAHGSYLMAGDTKVYVSDSDWRDLSRFTWCMSLEYPTSTIGRKTLQMQQYLLGKKKGFVADHKDGDKTNNRRTNLHFATHGFNNHNKPSRSSTGFKGVQRKAMLNNGNYNYGAEIKYEKKKHRLGTYPTALLAACAYDNAAKHFYGNDANINGVGDQQGYNWDLSKLRLIKIA